ncbi:hypothetical protein JVT61DRAFT_12195 [Boletus reticuloceps]|uniref:MYND-type domain-containing protein n=1 Tax=Boletus reticuloceps TaxID=495285 RepID=A0A8I3A458_9AGAM|nr:hypothetical protein JVT61DRAFT_12195 [Boletus reticuloceps]
MDAKKEIHVVHTTHPLNQELFRMMDTPREVSKAIKNTSQTQCTTCSTTRPKLQTCKQCKSVWYCSKECQRKDWPRHKAWCTPSDRPKGTRKLVETFVCNVTLATMLQVCAALDLNLVNDKKKEIGFKVPFMIRFFLTDEPISDKMEGMLQINRFHSHIPGQSGHIPLTQMRDTMWSGEREKLNGNPIHCNNPLGLVEFVNNDSDFSITCPLPISWRGGRSRSRCCPDLLAEASRSPRRLLRGVSKVHLLSLVLVKYISIRFMNLHIRADKENQLKSKTAGTSTTTAMTTTPPRRPAHTTHHPRLIDEDGVPPPSSPCRLVLFHHHHPHCPVFDDADADANPSHHLFHQNHRVVDEDGMAWAPP